MLLWWRGPACRGRGRVSRRPAVAAASGPAGPARPEQATLYTMYNQTEQLLDLWAGVELRVLQYLPLGGGQTLAEVKHPVIVQYTIKMINYSLAQ